MSRTFRAVIILAPLACTVSFGASRARSADGREHPAVDRLVSDWQARQERFHTGIIEWDQQQTHKRGSYLGASSEALRADRRFQRKYSLSFSGQAARLERSGPRWDLDTNSVKHEEFVNTFNGGSLKVLYAGEKFGPHPSGHHTRSTSLQEGAWDFHIDACVLAFRPLSQAFDGVDPRGWRFVETIQSASGGTLLVFEWQVNESGAYRFVIDTRNEHIPVRRELLVNGELRIRLDIEYRQDPAWGPVPESWTVIRVSRPPMKVTETIRSTVTKLTLNTPIDESRFDIEFAPGTVLADHRYEQQMLVRADGSLRPIEPEERRAGMSYTEMMTVDSPQMIARRSRRWILAAALACVAVVAGAFWLWRRRRT